MPARSDIITEIDLEDSTSIANLLVPDGMDMIRVQPVVNSGTWGSAVVTLQWSLTGGTTSARWSSLDEPLVLTSADEDLITSARYLSAIRFLRFVVSTNQSGTPGTLEIVVGSESSFVGAVDWVVTNSTSPS